MKSITHLNVHALLQAAADKTLEPDEQMALDAHLAGCENCRNYARELADLQAGLRRVTRQQWSRQNAALPMQSIKERSKRLAIQNRISATIGRFAVLPVLAIAFVMTVRMVVPQQIAVDITGSGTPQLSFHTPTPPQPLTATKLIAQACEKASYVVQPNDSLDGIAARFGVARESILQYNGLSSERLVPNTQLAIPICSRTPPGSTTTPTVTITLIPDDVAISPSPAG